MCPQLLRLRLSEEKSHQISPKAPIWQKKGNTKPSPAREDFKNRASYIDEVNSPIVIQAVVLHQSKDQPNQFSGS